MPYRSKGKCVYKKNSRKKVGCTKGKVKDYLAALHANVVNEDKIKGGKADDLSLNDIAKKFRIPVKQLKKQLEKGIKIESEHTDDEDKQKEIAMDHLSEFGDYYDRIEDMEKEAKKYWAKKLNKEGISDLIKQRLNEMVDLKKDNKLTYPKIPSDKLFKNNVESKGFNINDNSEQHNEQVNIKDIVPTQKNLNADNIKNVKNIDELIELFKVDDKYYVVDGHHRIANAILNGDKTIKAKVYTKE